MYHGTVLGMRESPVVAALDYDGTEHGSLHHNIAWLSADVASAVHISDAYQILQPTIVSRNATNRDWKFRTPTASNAQPGRKGGTKTWLKFSGARAM